MSLLGDLRIERVLKVPRANVWRAWSDPLHVAEWWSEHPDQVVIDKMELAPGGAFNTRVKLPDGGSLICRACFLEVVEGKRIIFCDALSEGWRPNYEAFFSAIITMDDHPEGTLYSATARHKSPEDLEEHKGLGLLESWDAAIGRLEALARGIS